MSKKQFSISLKKDKQEEKESARPLNTLGIKGRPVKVLNELREFITPLGQEAFQQLEKNILENGIREPLTFWKTDQEDILIDGHHRYEIAQKHGISYERNWLSFDDIEDVKQWMIRNQLGRRNLSPMELSYYRGMLYSEQKKSRGGLRTKGSKENTAAKIGEEFQVNEKTVKRDASFYAGMQHLVPELREKVLTGAVKIPKGQLQRIAASDQWNLTHQDITPQPVSQPDKKDKGFNDRKKQVEELKSLLTNFLYTPDKDTFNTLESKLKALKKNL